MLTDAPWMTAPVLAVTTPLTIAVSAGPPGSLSPHAATSTDVTTATASVRIDVGNRMGPRDTGCRGSLKMPGFDACVVAQFIDMSSNSGAQWLTFGCRT